MERYDLNWIIVLFSIHINDFSVHKSKKLVQRSSFGIRTQFGKLGSKNLKANLMP